MIKMDYKLKTVPMDRYTANLGKLSLIVSKAAADIEANAKDSIAKSSGQYKQYGSHWSSPPGTPPNSDTGNLANSISTRALSKTSAEVYVSAKYGVPLELGWTAKSGGTVPARPFLRPAVEFVAPSFQAACKSVLRGK